VTLNDVNDDEWLIFSLFIIFEYGSCTMNVVIKYWCCFDIQEALSVERAASQPSSTAAQRVTFILCPNVLRQLCCYGMTDLEQVN